MNSGNRSPDTLPYGPVAVGGVALGVFAWQTTDFDEAFDAIAAYRSALYLQPWRALTSAFLHQAFPHLIFNLVTLWFAGVRMWRGFGGRWFFMVFVLSILVGQVAHTLITDTQVIGMSGGICGFYGFLFYEEWRGSLAATLRSWAFFWVYPLLLLVLFVLDQVGLLDIANVSHLVAIASGWLLALGTGTMTRKAPIILVTATSLALLLVRPWDPVWQAIHGTYPESALLAVSECRPTVGPSTEVVLQAPVLVVTILNPDRRRLVVSYYDPEGELVETFRFNVKARSFRPYEGSVWRLDTEDGACLLQFDASRDGVVDTEKFVGN